MVMMSVIMLSVIMLSVIMLSALMPHIFRLGVLKPEVTAAIRVVATFAQASLKSSIEI